MQKMNLLGVGPQIVRRILPWLAITIIASIIWKETFLFFSDEDKVLLYIGLTLVILGAIMYFSTVPALLKGIRETKLVTKGTFYLCCNPLYAAIILFIFPGTAFLMNSWLVLTSSIVGYIAFRMKIKGEEAVLEENFGQEYKAYRETTPQFFPFPLKKLLR
jgi:protein-S-isoprenylcysteine O-methyltransferase Ste14